MGSGEARRTRERAVARDTIAAVATPPGRGGVGIVRISGPDAPRIAEAVLGRVPAPRQATLGRFLDSRGEPVDHGIALYFPAPHSFTGEPVLELQGHGGPVVMQSLLAACLDAGARSAEPGEFTRRAFLEGKLDLAQAEAVADLIDAASREAARSALRSLAGEFSDKVRALVSGLTELRALTEAMLDFPEEEIDSLHAADARARLERVRSALAELLAHGRRGRLLASGIHVVIAGRPNVGKSSLLNRLAGEERAIVTPVAGTTRDVLRESLEIDGVPVVLVDTAGLHASPDEIERIGMQRARQELEKASVALVVYDATNPVAPEAIPGDVARLDVFNKVDLVPGFVAPANAVAVSARTGYGLDELGAAILRTAGWTEGESVYLARERHLRALEEARLHLEGAMAQTSQWELFAEELRLAQAALSRITGEVTPDELLGEIFGRFCIGK